MPDVMRQIEIAAPLPRVWANIASETGLRRWISPDLTIDLRPGGAFRLTGGEGGAVITGEVLALVPQARLELSWMEEGSGWRHPARLVIALEAMGEGTRVRLTHGGFEGIGTATWRRTQGAYEAGVDRHALLHRLAEVTLAA